MGYALRNGVVWGSITEFRYMLAGHSALARIRLTQHPIPSLDRLLEKPQPASWGFSLSGAMFWNPSASRSDAICSILASTYLVQWPCSVDHMRNLTQRITLQ